MVNLVNKKILVAALWAALLFGASCGPAPAMMSDAVMFDPDWMIEVEIEVDEADWSMITKQVRNFADVFCNTEPPPNPFTYVAADVTIDDIRVESVGLRKKCFFGSCSEERPALKISFNEYVRGQRYFGMRRMTLNNCLSDPAWIKQCLGYWLFDRAGVISPRCNFAHVTVNGKDLGVYAHIESIKTELLARSFDDASGNVYEGALSDFQPNWSGTFQKKTNEDNPDQSDIQAMVEACAAPDDAFVDEVDALTDLDDFFTFWGMEVLIAHWDGYAGANHNNFYLYNDPQSGKLHFIPWGIDGTFYDRPDGLRAVIADAVLPHRLYKIPATRDLYLERLQHLQDTVWDQPVILAEIDRMEQLISPFADPRDTGVLGHHIEELRRFVRDYPAKLQAELQPNPPEWNRPLNQPPCLRQLGTLTASFSTSWGSTGTENPFGTGTGSIDAVVEENPIVVSLVGSAAGYDPNPEANQQPIVQLFGLVPGSPNDTYVLIQIMINDPALVTAGATVPLDMATAMGIMIEADPGKAPGSEVIYLLMDGELKFDQASMNAGAPVTGTITTNIRESGW